MAKGDKPFAALANAARLPTLDAVQSCFRIIFTNDGYNGHLGIVKHEGFVYGCCQDESFVFLVLMFCENVSVPFWEGFLSTIFRKATHAAHANPFTFEYFEVRYIIFFSSPVLLVVLRPASRAWMVAASS